jgi:7-cyano-7-deazaguanine synthase
METKPAPKSPHCDVVVVLSGGLDSTVVAYKLKNEGHRIRLLYIDYGKPSSKREKGAAKLVSLHLGVPLDIVDCRGLGQIQTGFVSVFGEGADELDSI